MYDIESDDTYSNLCDLPDELFNEIIDSENVTDFKKVKVVKTKKSYIQSKHESNILQVLVIIEFVKVRFTFTVLG